MADVTTTALRAKECGHVLGQATDTRLIKRMRRDFAMLLRIGDTRFELVEMPEDEAVEAFVAGLHGCTKCVITKQQTAQVAAIVHGGEAASDG